jgi:hypothetical protein
MFLRRAANYFLVFSATAGIIFSIIGLASLWFYRPRITQAVLNNLVLIDQTLTSTQSVLVTVNQMVQNTALNVESLQATTKALSTGIHDTDPMFESLMSLTGRDLPTAISATQTSLASAQSSALLIDNAITALTNVPFSPIVPYRPAVPLHISLANVASSLDSIKPSLEKINASLGKGKTDLALVDGELTKISETTQEINGSLGNAQTEISDYRITVSQLKKNVETAESRLFSWSLGLSWILTIALVWLLVGQTGLGLHGLELIRESHEIINPSKEP